MRHVMDVWYHGGVFANIHLMTHQELKDAVKAAMKNKDLDRLSVLRGILASATNELIAKGQKPDEGLGEEDLMAVMRRAAKQRKDSIEQFEKGGRPELAESEKRELVIIEEYLPVQMSEEDIRTAVEAKAAEISIQDKSGTNQLMGSVMKDLKGKADGVLVKKVVDSLFSA